jgi:hypothetical protein
MSSKRVKFYLDRADIEYMKKLALILLCGVATMALSAEEYTIQAISALKESSITPAFEQKIKKTGIPYIKKTEGDRHVVLLGSYKKAMDAKPAVKKVKTAVTNGAFVRPMDRTHVAVVTTSEKPAVHAEVSTHTSVTSASSAVDTNSHTVTAASPVVAAAVDKKEESTVACPAPVNVAPTAVVVIYDRNAMRKNDISQAIEYYKNSPYYTFRPVALQR